MKSYDDGTRQTSKNVGKTQLIFCDKNPPIIKEQVTTQFFNLSGAMDRNASIVWGAILLQLFLMVSCTLSQTTESSPPDSQAGRCSRNLQHTFDPLMNNVSKKTPISI